MALLELVRLEALIHDSQRISSYNHNLVRYSDVNRTGNTNSDPVFARVVSVGSSHITITGVTTVTGVAIGGTVATQIDVQDFTVLD